MSERAVTPPASPAPAPPVRVAGALATDLAGYAVFWAMLVVGGVVAVTAFTARFSTVDASIWLGSLGLLRWVVLVGGAIVVRSYVPLYVAHGIGRRDVLLGAAPVVVGLCALIGVVAAAGLAVEGVVYGAFGWQHAVSDSHDRFLYDGPDELLLIAVATAGSLLAYLVTGALIGASYARWNAVGGTAFLPVAVLPAVIAEVAAGGGWFGSRIESLGLPQPGTAGALVLTALVCAAGAAVVALLVRDISLNNDDVAWWR